MYSYHGMCSAQELRNLKNWCYRRDVPEPRIHALPAIIGQFDFVCEYEGASEANYVALYELWVLVFVSIAPRASEFLTASHISSFRVSQPNMKEEHVKCTTDGVVYKAAVCDSAPDSGY